MSVNSNPTWAQIKCNYLLKIDDSFEYLSNNACKYSSFFILKSLTVLAMATCSSRLSLMILFFWAKYSKLLVINVLKFSIKWTFFSKLFLLIIYPASTGGNYSYWINFCWISCLNNNYNICDYCFDPPNLKCVMHFQIYLNFICSTIVFNFSLLAFKNYRLPSELLKKNKYKLFFVI